MQPIPRLSVCLTLFVLILAPASLAAQAPAAGGTAPPPAPAAESDTTKEPPPAAADDGDKDKPAVDPKAVTVAWDNGLRMRTADNRFEMRFFGRLELDSSWIAEDEPFGGILGRVEDGFEVRRGRIGVSGYMYEHIEYRFEVDFAGGIVGGTDMYIGLRNQPITARFGHQKEPYSLEYIESSRYSVFIERSVSNMFAPARNAGLLLGDSFDGGKGTWAAGVFRDTDVNGWSATPGNNYNVTARVTHAPILENGGRRLLHVGGEVNQRKVDGNLRLTTRPGDHNAPNIIVVNIPATAATFTNVEAATTVGPAGMQSEYHYVWVESAERGDPTLTGGYVQGHIFLTGDFRNYGDGVFGQLKPRRNFLDGGPGAVQLAVRWSKIDVEEGLAAGTPGILSVLTIGANWWWNPHLRWRVNYDLARLDKVDDDTTHIFHWRAAIDW